MSIPRLQKAKLTERITLPIEPEIKNDLAELKNIHSVDVSEWLRSLIRLNLPKLKQDLDNLNA